MPRRELRATMKLQSETETQRNILKGEMNMLFQTESGQTVGPIGQGTWSNFRNGGFSRRIKSISGDDRKRDQ